MTLVERRPGARQDSGWAWGQAVADRFGPQKNIDLGVQRNERLCYQDPGADGADTLVGQLERLFPVNFWQANLAGELPDPLLPLLRTQLHLLEIHVLKL